MEVVDCEAPILGLLLADCADSALTLKHRVVLLLGEKGATERRGLLPTFEPGDRILRKLLERIFGGNLAALDNLFPIFAMVARDGNPNPCYEGRRLCLLRDGQ